MPNRLELRRQSPGCRYTVTALGDLRALAVLLGPATRVEDVRSDECGVTFDPDHQIGAVAVTPMGGGTAAW
jgi:hypothetical protein